MDLNKLKVPELRKELQARGLDSKGNKPVLVERLREAIDKEQGTWIKVHCLYVNLSLNIMWLALHPLSTGTRGRYVVLLPGVDCWDAFSRWASGNQFLMNTSKYLRLFIIAKLFIIPLIYVLHMSFNFIIHFLSHDVIIQL